MAIVLLCICVVPILLAQGTESPVVKSSCIHVAHESGRYSLSYFGHPCPHLNYTVLPATLYDTLAAWTHNSTHAKTLSLLDAFAINARLASLESSFEKIPAGIGHSLVLWPYKRYKWTKRAGMALAIAKDALGTSSPVVKKMLEDPYLKMGLAQVLTVRVSATKTEPYFDMKDTEEPTDSRRARLVAVFLAAESVFGSERERLAPSLSVEEASMQVPSHAEARRKNLGVFRLTEL